MSSALAFATPRPGESARWAAFWGRPQPARDASPGEVRRTVVDARGAIVGALAGRLDGPDRFVVHGLRARPDAAPALAAHLAALAPRIEVGLWAHDLDAALHAALRAAGFAPVVEVVRVERRLEDLPPDAGALTLRRLASTGAAVLRAAVSRCLAGTRNRPAPADADVLLDGAAAHGVVGRWSVAFLGERPAGVVLPVVREGRGSLALVGVVPALRGRGLARPLLALGLAELAAAGATLYADGTDIENEPMWRTFAALGCQYLGTEHRLVKEHAHG